MAEGPLGPSSAGLGTHRSVPESGAPEAAGAWQLGARLLTTLHSG